MPDINQNDTTKLISLTNLGTYHDLMDAKKEEKSIILTQAEYDALTPAEKMNGKTYFISDAGSSGIIIKNGIVYGGSMNQVQSNYTESDSTSPAYIRNKPTLGSASAKDSTTSITEGGTDLPTSGAVYTALQNVHIDVDTTLDTTSDNPIANSAVATALNGKVDAVNGKGLSTNDYTDADQSKLSNIAAGAEVNVQSNWNESDSDSDAFILNKPTLGTAAAKDSTTSVTESSTDLITSGAVYTALSGKVDTESGKGLSTNDYTTEEKTKLSGIATGAEVNVQSNWSETDNSSDAYIQNKPTALSAFTNDSGFITNTVNNLTNYYAKTESYSKTEVDSMISAAKSGRFIYVATLPTTDIHTDAIYLVPKTVSQTDNVKDEYINLDGTSEGWEKIGDTEIDLTDYVQKSQTAGLLKNDGTVDTNTYLTSVPTATSSALGIVQPDGSTITINSNGVISASTDLSNYIEKSATEGLVKNDGSIDESEFIRINHQYEGVVIDKIWNVDLADGSNIWTDGENIFYSATYTHYKLDKTTGTWSTESSVYGLDLLYGSRIWTDGENIYHSYGYNHYVLDKSVTPYQWVSKTWYGLTNFQGQYIWTDGTNIYYSNSSNQYILDKSTSTWNTKTWNGFSNIDARFIWTDGTNIYYSNSSKQYILDKSTSTWTSCTWNVNQLDGARVWEYNNKIYYSNNSDQYIFDKTNNTWIPCTWEGHNSFEGWYIWKDGNKVYHSHNDYEHAISYQYEINNIFGFVKSDGTIDTNDYALNSVATTTGNGLMSAADKTKLNAVISTYPLATTYGGTGNGDGYIRTGQLSGSTMGSKATAEGYDTTASGDYSHAEGKQTIAEGDCSHAEGGSIIGSQNSYYNTASGDYSHVEGLANTASGEASHAEGRKNTASGNNSHAEGSETTASGNYSHTEGFNTSATNSYAHAEGCATTASGYYSHAAGIGTVAGYSGQTVVGKFNDNKSDTLFEVGNGMGSDEGRNAFEVKSNGDIFDGHGNSLTAVSDALFSDDTTTVDYTNVITLQNAPDVHAQSLRVKFEPIQSGSGDPSPSNVRPISGHTGASAVVEGRNIANPDDFVTGKLNADGTVDDTATFAKTTGYLPAKESTTYFLARTVGNSVGIAVAEYDANKVFLRGTSITGSGAISNQFATTGTGLKYIRVTCYNSQANKAMVAESSTELTYEDYISDTHTTPFGDTYYSGYVDVVTGELVVTHAKTTITEFSAKSGSTSNNVFYKPISDIKRISGDLTPSLWSDKYVAMPYNTITANDITTGMGVNDYGNICVGFGLDSEIDTLEKANAWATAHPIEVCYELATPIRIALTPQLVKLFKGYNTIYSSDGQVRLEYTANLITCLNEDIAKKADNAALAPVEDSATAKRPYQKGQHFMRDGEFCTALASIASGASFTRGTNYKGGDVADAFDEVNRIYQASNRYTCETTDYEYTDVSLTLSPGTYLIAASVSYGGKAPTGVAINSRNDSLVVPIAMTEAISGVTHGNLTAVSVTNITAESTTFYVWAKWAAASTNTVLLTVKKLA